MGAFLSEPVTEKISADEEHERLSYGVCSMQGWRFTQEDNHSCFPSLDDKTSLFGVYDGHGGAEVSRYVASLLPDYVLERECWKEGEIGKALSEAFLALDAHLGSRKGLRVLKKLAAEDNAALDKEKTADEDGDSEDSEENVRNLFKEAKMPLEMLMAKYGQALAAARNAEESSEEEDAPSASNSPKGSKSKENASGDSPKGNKSKDEVSEASPKGGKSKDESSEGSPKGSKAKDESSEGSPKGSKAKDESKGDVGSSPGKGSRSEGKKEKEVEKKEKEVEKKEKEVEEKVRKEKGGEEEGEEDTEDDKPKENGLPELEKPTKNGSADRLKLRSRLNRIVYSDNDDDEDTSDEEYDENSSPMMEEKGEEGEGSSGEEDDDDEDEMEGPLATSTDFALNMLQGPGLDSGCTAVVAVLQDGGKLFVANAGDSRCILSRRGVAVDMSVDHKPEDEEESKRIVEAGGEVTSEGRVNGGLNLSRALGDHAYKQGECGARKQMISALPDVRRIQLQKDEDEFMVLACDGIWNSMTSQEVVDFIRERLYKKDSKDDVPAELKERRKLTEGMKLSKICGELFEHCLAPNTSGDGTGCDNMTAVLVTFKEPMWKEGDDGKPKEKGAAEVMVESKDGKAEENGIVLLTPPPSPPAVVSEEVDEESSEEEDEDEDELEEEEDEEEEDEEGEEEKVEEVKTGKGCKRPPMKDSPTKAKKQKIEEETS